jgi:hypothetical protein
VQSAPQCTSVCFRLLLRECGDCLGSGSMDAIQHKALLRSALGGLLGSAAHRPAAAASAV